MVPTKISLIKYEVVRSNPATRKCCIATPQSFNPATKYR